MESTIVTGIGTMALSATDFEAEFYRLLGRLACAHSRFDRNIGLQLNAFSRWYGGDVTEFLDPKKVPFSKRLKKLRSMVLAIFQSSGAKGLAELRNYFDRVSEATALRNDYIHGCWSWHYPNGVGKGLILVFAPLHWDMSPNRPDDSVTMELGEFAEQVKNAEILLSQYYGLFDKYRRFAKPPQTDTNA